MMPPTTSAPAVLPARTTVLAVVRQQSEPVPNKVIAEQSARLDGVPCSLHTVARVSRLLRQLERGGHVVALPAPRVPGQAGRPAMLWLRASAP